MHNTVIIISARFFQVAVCDKIYVRYCTHFHYPIIHFLSNIIVIIMQILLL